MLTSDYCAVKIDFQAEILLITDFGPKILLTTNWGHPIETLTAHLDMCPIYKLLILVFFTELHLPDWILCLF